MDNENRELSRLDRAWGIAKIVIIPVSSIMILIFVFFASNSNNLKQTEILRGRFLTKKMSALGSKDLSSKDISAIAISLALFKKRSISPLIALLKSNVLSEIVPYWATFEDTVSLGLFAAKGGYNLSKLSQTSDASIKIDERQSDPTTDDYLPDELLPQRYRYRILLIPFKCRGFKIKLPSGLYLDEALHKYLGEALKDNRRFFYIDLDEYELSKIRKLDNESRFKPKAVRKVVEKYLQHVAIDGILIGAISERMEKEDPSLRKVEAYLYDLEIYRAEILTVTHWNKFRSDKDVYSFAVELIKRLQSRFPFRVGKVTKVTKRYFMCEFKGGYLPLLKNMKLMIFKPDETMLDTQGKIYKVTTKNKAGYCMVQARWFIKGEGEVVQEGDIVVTK